MGKVCYEKEKKFVHGLGVAPQCKALIFCPGEEEGRAAFLSCWLYVLERFKLHLLKTRPAKCATVFAFLSWNLKKIQQKNYQNLPILKQMQIGWHHYTQRIYSRQSFAVRPNLTRMIISNLQNLSWFCHSCGRRRECTTWCVTPLKKQRFG